MLKFPAISCPPEGWPARTRSSKGPLPKGFLAVPTFAACHGSTWHQSWNYITVITWYLLRYVASLVHVYNLNLQMVEVSWSLKLDIFHDQKLQAIAHTLLVLISNAVNEVIRSAGFEAQLLFDWRLLRLFIPGMLINLPGFVWSGNLSLSLSLPLYLYILFMYLYSSLYIYICSFIYLFIYSFIYLFI